MTLSILNFGLPKLGFGISNMILITNIRFCKAEVAHVKMDQCFDAVHVIIFHDGFSCQNESQCAGRNFIHQSF